MNFDFLGSVFKCVVYACKTQYKVKQLRQKPVGVRKRVSDSIII